MANDLPHPPTSPGHLLPYEALKTRHALLLLGLRELRDMIRFADDRQASADDTLTAVTARLVALIEAHDGNA
jgi:hypothetical protein